VTPDEIRLRDAFLAECWKPCREYHDPMPSLIPALYDAPRNVSPPEAENGGETVDRAAS
jgi:hypothetical protein